MAGRWLSSTTRMSRSRMSASSCGSSGSIPKAPLTYRVRCASPMQDSMIMRSAKSTPSTTPRAADGAEVSGMSPRKAVRGSANQSGPRSGRVCGMNTGAVSMWSGSALNAVPISAATAMSPAAVSEPFCPVGESVAAVDDAVDQPPAGSHVSALQGPGTVIGDSEGVGHHMGGSHDQQRPATGFGTQCVGRCRGIARSDDDRDPLAQTQSRSGCGQQRSEHAQ